MAVVNQYDFVGIDNDTTNTALNPLVQAILWLVKPMLSNLS